MDIGANVFPPQYTITAALVLTFKGVSMKLEERQKDTQCQIWIQDREMQEDPVAKRCRDCKTEG